MKKQVHHWIFCNIRVLSDFALGKEGHYDTEASNILYLYPTLHMKKLASAPSNFLQ